MGCKSTQIPPKVLGCILRWNFLTLKLSSVPNKLDKGSIGTEAKSNIAKCNVAKSSVAKYMFNFYLTDRSQGHQHGRRDRQRLRLPNHPDQAHGHGWLPQDAGGQGRRRVRPHGKDWRLTPSDGHLAARRRGGEGRRWEDHHHRGGVWGRPRYRHNSPHYKGQRWGQWQVHLARQEHGRRGQGRVDGWRHGQAKAAESGQGNRAKAGDIFRRSEIRENGGTCRQ